MNDSVFMLECRFFLEQCWSFLHNARVFLCVFCFYNEKSLFLIIQYNGVLIIDVFLRLAEESLVGCVLLLLTEHHYCCCFERFDGKLYFLFCFLHLGTLSLLFLVV